MKNNYVTFNLMFLFFSLSAPGFASESAEFLFGASNSAFQVEGQPAASDWQKWSHTKGKISDGTNADVATDFWNRYEEDFKLARDYGMNAFRISVAWERVEPHPGAWDEKALSHYALMILKMREFGLEPIVTLHHYTLPLWVSEKGGVTWAKFPEHFGVYAKHVVASLGAGAAPVRYFMTINEPNILVRFGYLDAHKFPPGIDDPNQAVKALAGLAKAHIEAYRQIKILALKEVKVSFAHNWQVFEPLRKEVSADQTAAKKVNAMFNRAFMDAVTTGTLVFEMPGANSVREKVSLPDGKATVDYLGVQNYGRSFVTSSHRAPFFRLSEGNGPKNDLDWELVPEALYESVKQASEYGFPILISETGLADAADRARPEYLRNNFKAIRRLINEKVALFGYLHWSLTDNFEWAFGLNPRFGLIDVDYRTLERKPRPSLSVFRELIRDFRRGN